MEIMGCPFAPLGLMFSVIYNFRGLYPCYILTTFQVFRQDMTELIVFPRVGSSCKLNPQEEFVEKFKIHAVTSVVNPIVHKND